MVVLPGTRHRIYTAPVEKVVRHADLVIRGSFEPATGRLEVLKLWGAADKLETVTVHNSASLPEAIRKKPGRLDASRNKLCRSVQASRRQRARL